MLNADVWMNFGSFAYGVELNLTGFQSDDLHFELLDDAGFSAAELLKLLEKIKKRHRALIFTEIRVYMSDLSMNSRPLHMRSEFPLEFLADTGKFRVRYCTPLSPPDLTLFHSARKNSAVSQQIAPNP